MTSNHDGQYYIKLIEEIKKRPGIWDVTDLQYRDNLLKPHLWIEVIDNLFGNGITDSARERLESSAKTDWKNLYKGYEKKKCNVPNKKFSAAEKSLIDFHEHLGFFDKCIRPIKSNEANRPIDETIQCFDLTDNNENPNDVNLSKFISEKSDVQETQDYKVMEPEINLNEQGGLVNLKTKRGPGTSVIITQLLLKRLNVVSKNKRNLTYIKILKIIETLIPTDSNAASGDSDDSMSDQG